MKSAITYDQSKQSIAEIYNLHKEGKQLLCPFCNSILTVLLDFEEVQKKKIQGGIFCPFNKDHVAVKAALSSLEILPKLKELEKNHGWDPDVKVIAIITNDNSNRPGEKQELQLVQVTSGRYILNRIESGQNKADFKNESEIYNDFSEVIEALKTKGESTRIAGELDQRLLTQLKKR